MAKRLSSLFTNSLPAEDKASRQQQRSVSPGALSPLAAASPDTSRARSPGRLAKLNTKSRQLSGQFLTPTDPSQPTLQELKQGLANDDVLPAPPSVVPGVHSRSSSVDRSRPGTPRIQLPDQPSATPTAESNEKLKKKRWGKNGKKEEEPAPVAWIAGQPHKHAYDAEGLKNAKPMPELWNEVDGNCFVYLFPRTSGAGPSFKIDTALIASSPKLTKLAFGNIYSSQAIVDGDRKQMPLDARTQQLNLYEPVTPPMSPKLGPGESVSESSRDSRGRFSNSSDSPETSLYLPIKLHTDAIVPGQPSTLKQDDKTAMEDLQTLVDYRNFFAFLAGQSLVATERRPSLFQIFMTISGILKSFQFSNVDGSTFGEVASSSFERYVEELGLGDVRSSREKTIEGIVLGERMKSVVLYNEAFTHGAGKHNDLLGLKSPKFDIITPITQNRLARAAMDLDKRTASIRSTLTHLEFPNFFTGIMASKSSAERKEGVRFDAWKETFLGMRKFTLALMKQKYGDWPPKASSKKNTLETSGLNRLVLRDLYHDLCSMYDLLVDKTSLTTRTIDGIDLADNRDSPTIRGMRIALSEYDRSSPPVKPPMPFDLPRLPTLRSDGKAGGTGTTGSGASSKKLKDEEISRILRASWNDDARVTPFVDVFRDMERRAAGHSCTLAELEDLRIGQWLFLYACLQALPMLALDAPGLRCTSGVEYFLCEPPRAGVPWAEPGGAGAAGGAGGGAGARTWFTVAGAGGGVVSLPSDLVEHGVEGIYRRSHCWRMAEKWTAENPVLHEALREHQQLEQGAIDGSEFDEERWLADPQHFHPSARGGAGHLRTDSLASQHAGKRQSSWALGLEALPLPAGVTPDGSLPTVPDRVGARTPRHSVDASKTFDAILGGIAPPPSTKPPAGKKGKK